MTRIDEKLEPIRAEVLRRNVGEAEFHQAVHEVVDSLGRVIAKHPDWFCRKFWIRTERCKSGL